MESNNWDNLERAARAAFNKLLDVSPAKNLSQTILRSIAVQQKASAQRMIAVQTILGVAVVVLSLFVFPMIYTQMVSNGVTSTLSLIASDWQAVVSNWKDFTLLLLESLPLDSLAAGLVCVTSFLLIARSLTKNLNKFYYSLRYNK